MDHREWLRRLAMNDTQLPIDRRSASDASECALDQKTQALVRVAALIAAGGAVPSYAELSDAAVSCGASAAEIVGVLVAVVPVVGMPCVVEAAPRLAMSLGYELDDQDA